MICRHIFPYLVEHFEGRGVSAFRIFTGYRFHDGTVELLGGQYYPEVMDVCLARCLDGMAHSVSDLCQQFIV